MDSTWVDTSLDLNLNLNLLNPRSEIPKREFKFKGDHHFSEFEERALVKQENGVLVEELNRISTENKKLTEKLSVLCKNYNNLQKQYMDLMTKNTENELAMAKKRKAESEDYYSNMIGLNGHTECSSTSDEESCKEPKENNIKPKVYRVYVRANASDSTLIVKDGYQWRKYGQKVTKDNPSPRAYFKCSFAPSCCVKKKVQRSAADPSMLVVTYEGKHNHPQPDSKAEQLSLSPSNGATIPISAVTLMRSTSPTVNLDMIQPGLLFDDDAKRSTIQEIEAPAVQQILVQQMASNLTRDPNFTAALAAAISGRFVDQKKKSN
uniref:WRKY transcription factor protein 15 n=1 Tax=Zanthoxylum armatum TaxID=67938 RepID=A0A8F1NP26_9ROSI|nr:WRKY transcription factor protein 15 [Zanthoxylum armatum]